MSKKYIYLKNNKIPICPYILMFRYVYNFKIGYNQKYIIVIILIVNFKNLENINNINYNFFFVKNNSFSHKCTVQQLSSYALKLLPDTLKITK